MAGDRDHDDLLEQLRLALADDEAVPPELIVAAEASFTWRTIDSELAELTYDSLLDDDRLVTLRGTATASGPRALSFEQGDVVVDIEVAESGTARHLLGQITGPVVESVVIERTGGEATAAIAVDDLGRFRASSLVRGPVRVRCRFGAAIPDVVTDWFVV